jgi:hypothetical protein
MGPISSGNVKKTIPHSDDLRSSSIDIFWIIVFRDATSRHYSTGII